MTPFESYIAPARALPGAWRALVGLLMIGLIWIAATAGVLLIWAVGAISTGTSADVIEDQLTTFTKNGDPLEIFLLLLSFSGIWLGVYTAAHWLHRQRLRSILSAWPIGAIRGFCKGMLLTVATIIVFTGVTWVVGLVPEEPTRIADLETWLIWLVPIALAVLIQASAEELIFRGYLLQQLAARSDHWIVWAVIPSILFGLLHYGDREGLQDAYYVGTTFFMGMCMCVLVWRSGSLWPAIGMHVSNNIYALLIAGHGTESSGTELWVYPGDSFEQTLQLGPILYLVLLVILISPAGRVFDRRRSAGY
ncbi:MAG: CPBP family intramembrane glutamic endopeptidase [Pseudomonadota bacterium]